jgi:anion-transporting  ArsA/GET3 family ATPase
VAGDELAEIVKSSEFALFDGFEVVVADMAPQGF